LDLGVNQNSSPVPVPLRRVVTSIRVSTLDPILAAFTILSFHHGHDLALSVGGGRGESRDANVPSDAARRETRLPSSEETWACEEREREIGAPLDGQ
jgi:hypothetical protein